MYSGPRKVQSHMQCVSLYYNKCFRHYRRALGALLVYDVTKAKTFEGLKGWLENLKNHSEKDIVVMLVGNKVEEAIRDPEAREVPKEVAQEFAD